MRKQGTPELGTTEPPGRAGDWDVSWAQMSWYLEDSRWAAGEAPQKRPAGSQVGCGVTGVTAPGVIMARFPPNPWLWDVSVPLGVLPVG